MNHILMAANPAAGHMRPLNSFFTELLPRLKSIEFAGEPQLSATTFVGGLKHLPIRYELSEIG